MKPMIVGTKRRLLRFGLLCLAILLVGTPSLFIGYVRLAEDRPPHFREEFPVTVNPKTETIIADKRVEAYLESEASPLQASASVAFSKLRFFFSSLLATFSNFAVDHSLALARQVKVVTIAPGARKEEVVDAFSRVLGWSAEEKKEFLNVDEGTLFPGTYAVDAQASPYVVRTAMQKRFQEQITSRYGPAVEEVVPLTTALTIASLIQKETIGTRDMRLVSGIIWNRLFDDQKLQLDATLQYAKASKLQNGRWWPKVYPRDKFIESSYNTYEHGGLPPTPIANPSVAAVVAALNPLQTNCYFYFHDTRGDIHCSSDYETHARRIEEVFGPPL